MVGPSKEDATQEMFQPDTEIPRYLLTVSRLSNGKMHRLDCGIKSFLSQIIKTHSSFHSAFFF